MSLNFVLQCDNNIFWCVVEFFGQPGISNMNCFLTTTYYNVAHKQLSTVKMKKIDLCRNIPPYLKMTVLNLNFVH